MPFSCYSRVLGLDHGRHQERHVLLGPRSNQPPILREEPKERIEDAPGLHSLRTPKAPCPAAWKALPRAGSMPAVRLQGLSCSQPAETWPVCS